MNIVYLMTFFGSSFAFELPLYFPKCCINDPNISNCVLEAAMKVKPFIQKGVKELHIKDLYPIVLPNFVIDHLAEGGNFISNTKDFAIYGMNNYNIKNIQFEPKAITVTGQINFKELFTHCSYTITKGYLIGIPIIGNGVFGGLLGPMNITFRIDADLIDRDGTEYAQLKNLTIHTDIKQYTCQFQGLAYEKGPWGNTNEVLRQNNELVGKAVSLVYDHMFQTFTSTYLKTLLDEIPYSHLFPC